MSDNMNIFLLLIGSFFVGSIPFGLLLVRLAGKGDVRSVGSGNIGATNVVRAGGKWLGILTMVLDASKGFFPVFLARHFEFFGFGGAEISLAALAAVVGHMFMPWLRFKGGKGVATTLGAALAFNPWMILPSLGVFMLTVALTRYVSLGSILGALTLPIFLLFVLFKGDSTDLAMIFIVWTVLALLVIIKHYANIKRLLNGAENPLWGKQRKGKTDE